MTFIKNLKIEIQNRKQKKHGTFFSKGVASVAGNFANIIANGYNERKKNIFFDKQKQINCFTLKSMKNNISLFHS